MTNTQAREAQRNGEVVRTWDGREGTVFLVDDHDGRNRVSLAPLDPFQPRVWVPLVDLKPRNW
jgi:hypothetical protein